MQTKKVPFTFKRRGYFYFTRRVPKDLRQHYDTPRIVEGLRTKSPAVAKTRALISAAKLDEYWHQLRTANPQLPGSHRLKRALTVGLPVTQSDQDYGPKLSEALQTYFLHKGKGKSQVFFNVTNRACDYLIDAVEDKELGLYSRADAITFRDALVSRGLAGSSVARLLNCITAVFNFNIQELALELNNPFSGLYHDKKAGVRKRKTISREQLYAIQAACRHADDDMRWLIALLSDTGLRLAEGAGLLVSDFDLAADIPVVHIRPHAWRTLKTAGSERVLPLVGTSLWAAQRISANNQPGGFAFPRYNRGEITNSNAASASLNKWLKPYVDSNSTLHSFRHSLRDRLRAVECPSDIVDQIGGWTTAGIGQSYGSGYPVEVLDRWLSKAVMP